MYSSTREQSNKRPGTRLKTESETGEGLARTAPFTDFFTVFEGKKPTVLQSTHKVNSRCFKICRSYSLSFILSNIVEIFWSFNFKELQEKENPCLFSRPQRIVKIRRRLGAQRRQRNVQKVRCTCRVVLPILTFFRSCCHGDGCDDDNDDDSYDELYSQSSSKLS